MAAATLVSGGYDINYLLELDVLSFSALSEVAAGVRSSRLLDIGMAVRAGQADEKGWKSFVEALDPQAKQVEEKNDADKFKNFVRFGGLGGGR